jgi:ornithine cyclodeaminase/alanine dehydrogenase-like protein (mu-crystallin family)
MLILNESDLRRALKMSEVIAAVEEGFRALARGDVRIPERLRLMIPERKAVMIEMPAYAHSLVSSDHSETGGDGALGSKIVSVFEQNAVRGMDVVQAVYVLLDPETGSPVSVMDGRFITAIRTAATSAVATKLMAARGPKRLAIFGAGVQARSHIEAMTCVAQVERITITSRAI